MKKCTLFLLISFVPCTYPINPLPIENELPPAHDALLTQEEESAFFTLSDSDFSLTLQSTLPEQTNAKRKLEFNDDGSSKNSSSSNP